MDWKQLLASITGSGDEELRWLSSRHNTAHEGAIHGRERVGERLKCDHHAAA
jgi:hypothetical protein